MEREDDRAQASVTRCQALIDELWDFNDAAGSERRLRAARAQPIARGDQPSALELLTQVSRALGLQRRFREAHAALDEVQSALPQKAAGQFAAAHVRLLLERGRVLNSSGDADAALPLFESSHRAAIAAGLDSLAIDAAHMIAIVHGARGREAEAMTWNLAALDMAERSTQARARQWRGSLHNNIGWTLHDAGRFEEALAHFERAFACRLEHGRAEEIGVARWCIARCLRSLGRIEEALAAQRGLSEDRHALGADDDGFIEEELGECLLALGRAEEAAPHFRRAYELLAQDAWLAERQPERLARLGRLAAQGRI